MIKNEYVLPVDIKRKMTDITPTFVQYDSASLVFKIYDNGKPFDLENITRAEVSHKRPDGKTIIGVGTPELNENGQTVIRYTYMGNEMRNEGFVEAALSVYSVDKKVSIFPFTVKIITDLRDGLIEPSNEEYGILQELIVEVGGLVSDSSKAVEDASKATVDAKQAVVDATTAITEANKAKDSVVLATQDATQATSKANLATAEAKTATVEANNAAQHAFGVATNAETIANSAAQNATDKANLLDQKMLTVDTAIADVNSARDKAIASANNADLSIVENQKVIDNSTHVGEFDVSKQYYKNNEVRVNGSSYVALQDTIGNRPPTPPETSNLHWELRARHGIDGKGSVASVNGVSPDANGNVTLTSFDIELHEHLNKTVIDGLSDLNGQLQYKGVAVGSVTAVNNKTGNVVITAQDVGAIPIAEKGIPNGVARLNEFGKVVDSMGLPVEGNVTSVNGQTGDVVINVEVTAGQAEANAKAYTDTEMLKKVDKEVGKQLSTEDFTTVEKTKLAGIQNGANNYTHPDTHPASMITQDINHRMLSDAKIAELEAKANATHQHTTKDIPELSNGLGNLEINSINTNAISEFRGDIIVHSGITAKSPLNGYKNVINSEGKVFYQGEDLDTRYPNKSTIGDMSLLNTTEKSSVVGAVNELFTSVSSGKQQIATAITDKGVLTNSSDTFTKMATNIGQIKVGVDSADATAHASDILTGKTAYVNNAKVTGTMPNRGAIGTVMPTITNRNYASGYYDAFSVAGNINLTSSNIRSGVNLFGVVGNLAEGKKTIDMGGVVSQVYIPSGATSFTVQYYPVSFNPSVIVITVPNLTTNGGGVGGSYRKGYVNTHGYVQTAFESTYNPSTLTLSVTFLIYQSPGYYFNGQYFLQNWSQFFAIS